jgi:hypothetical protein
MCRAGAMTGFTHGNARIRSIGDVQSQGMQGVRKMICLQSAEKFVEGSELAMPF